MRRLVLALVIPLLAPLGANAQAFGDAPIAYNGRLELDGAPVDGTYAMRFGIVLTAGASSECLVAGSCTWWEEHAAVDVAGGRFSVALGEVTAFPATLFSSGDLYLLVAVYDGAAGWKLLGDRQRLLAVPRAARTEQIAPPVGSIVAWHPAMFPGSPPSLPSGWARCDGQLLSDAQSPLNGRTLPNLNGQHLFLRGATSSGTVQDDRMQTHRHLDSGHQHGFTRPRWFSFETANGEYIYNPESAAADGQTSTTHTGHAQLGDPVDSNGAATVRHGDETRPKNMGVVWIMRVR